MSSVFNLGVWQYHQDDIKIRQSAMFKMRVDLARLGFLVGGIQSNVLQSEDDEEKNIWLRLGDATNS